MKTCCRCKVSKPFTEFSKDKGKRDGLHARCKPCNRAAVSAWQRTPKGRAKHAANADRWQRAPENKASHALAVSRYHNTERGKAKLRAAWAKYNACKLQRTPTWLNPAQLQEIEDYYSLAKELQWLSEKPLHVDHIVPLQGDTVSGLHVPWNLQILPEPMNCSKNNKLVG